MEEAQHSDAAIQKMTGKGQELIILDEPMNGLDKNGVAEMRQLFLQLKEQGKTILIASHNPDDTRILCDTLHEMDAGVMTERELLDK